MKKIPTILFALLSIGLLRAQDAKMHDYVSRLMSRMTIDEKIGQLNLVTPGGTNTGSVVSKNVDSKIRMGKVGGLFGITGPDKVRKAQETEFTWNCQSLLIISAGLLILRKAQRKISMP